LISGLDGEYIKYLISSQVNYTQSYMGTHHNGLSHDQINRFMRGEKFRPRHLWQAVRADVVPHADGYIVFDDTTLDKRYSEKIEVAQVQYSGASHGLVMGINIVTCLYVNPELDHSWNIDYRMYNPIADGKDKLEHVADMLHHSVEWKRLEFGNVLFDSWYATHDLGKQVDDLGKRFYCPIKANRNILDGLCWKKPTQLEWNDTELVHGKAIRLKGQKLSADVRLHRLSRVSHGDGERIEYILTNDPAHPDTDAVAHHVGIRWKIEQLHREVKQVTAIGKCQCREAKAQRNHIACAFIAWVMLKRAAHACKTTIYQLKQALLDSYVNQTLNNPRILTT
jgi:Transposase DDE domain